MKRAAFVTLSTKQMVANSSHHSLEERLQDVPLCVMLSRWDGLIGFLGGKAEDSDTDLLTAAFREFEEETGVSIEQFKSQAELVAVLDNRSVQSTLYNVFLQPHDFNTVVSQFKISQDYTDEGSHIVVYLEKFGSVGIDCFLQHNFAPMACWR